MKVKIKNDILTVVKVSSLSAIIACGSGGGKKSIGVDTSSLSPKKVIGSSADGVTDVNAEGTAENQAPDVGPSNDHSNTPSDSGSLDPKSTDSSVPSQDSNESPTPESPGMPSKEPDIQKIFAKTGIRNFAQINATMSVLTGVPTTNTQVATFYAAQATSLPTENDVKGFIGSHQVTVFKLAVEYCDVLVKDTALRTTIFGSFNFAGAPNVAFTPDTKKALADNLVTKFWGKDLTTLSPHAENVSMVVTLIDDLLTGRDLTIATQTPGIVTGACAGVLSSAPVTLY